MKKIIIFFLFFILGICVRNSAGVPNANSWEELEAQGATISSVEIRTENVFDTTQKGEKHWLGRAANFIHIITKEKVVERELLFKAGDKVHAHLIRESERNLRACQFIREASIVPVEEGPGLVKAVVTAWDSWSLNLGVKFNQAGGDQRWSVKLHELNLLGLGKGLKVSYQQDEERDTKQVAYTDPRLFGSRWAMELAYSDYSDGRGRRAKIEKPFFSVDTKWAFGLLADGEEQVMNFYNDDQTAYKAPTQREHYAVSGSYAYKIAGTVSYRLAMEYRDTRNSYGELEDIHPGQLPAPDLINRKYRGPILYWSMVQDRYRTFKNMKVMTFTEDYNTGWEVKVGAGYFFEGLGSTEDAFHGELHASKGWMAGEKTLFLFESESDVRHGGEGWENSLTHTKLVFYNRSFPRQTLAGIVQVDGGTRLDPEEWLYLGGFDGVRGYPNHFRAGDRRWTASFEDRVITDKVLFGILQVGFGAYADAGAIRQYSDGRWSKVYSDVGFGLRLGDLKSAFGRVLLFTVAFPLVREPGMDKYQFVFGNVIRF